MDAQPTPSLPPAEPPTREHAEPVSLKKRLSQRGQDVLYPSRYLWLVLFSSMDIMLTWVVLAMGGREINWIAAQVIHEWGLPGAILFKFALVTLFIVACEMVGRMKPPTGRRLASVGVLISAFPVVWTLLLLLSVVHAPAP